MRNMRWPFNKRADPTHAWGTIGAAIASAAIVVTALATLHPNPHFRWWWPTNWMAIPAAILVLGLILLVVPIRRSLFVQGTTNGRLPLVREAADLDARVHRAVLPLPYIHRDTEDEARLHLNSGRPVLLVGSSMVGKTKMAATLIRETFPERRVAVPDTREALASMDTAEIPVRDSVIFLDDIGRLVGAGGVTNGGLHRLVAAGNIIIGTIRAAEYDRFQPTNQFRPPEWDILSVFERVFINRELSYAEQERLAEAVADPGIRERVRRVGLGEYTGAAERIAEALRLGPSVSPAGFALVLGAADWRRAGMSGPVPALVLRDLAAPHLPARHSAELSSDQAYRAALGWATRDINPTVALLQPTGADTFMVYDYALDLLSKARPMPDATWSIVIRYGNPSDLLSIGFTAQTIFVQSEVARKAWSKAADCRDADIAPRAAGFLAGLLAEQGDVDGARQAFQRAIDSGHPEIAPMAASGLAGLLAEQGDVDGARQAFQRAIDSGHPEIVPMAVLGLAALLQEQGDTDGARQAFQRAIDSGHPFIAPMAVLGLAALLQEQGDSVGARQALLETIDSGHAEHPQFTADVVGQLLKEQGDTDGAQRAFQRAIDSGHPDIVPRAAVGLGQLLQEQGDTDGARRAYLKAIVSGQRDTTRMAAVGLGELLQEQGGTDGAWLAYQQTIDSGHDEDPLAAVGLGLLLQKQGDADGARQAFQLAIDSGHPDAAPVGAFNLGELLAEQGDADGARQAFQLAIDSGHPDAAPVGAFNLGELLAEQGDADGARQAFQLAIDSGHNEHALEAAFALCNLLWEQGDRNGAQQAFQQAFNSMSPEQANFAQYGLGLAIHDTKFVDEVQRLGQLRNDGLLSQEEWEAALKRFDIRFADQMRILGQLRNDGLLSLEEYEAALDRFDGPAG